ncbi:DUF2235 domain-containing protein [Limnohabitans sp. DM1]|uniref:T6SS phospholipase effector Tle1-like catalytic domain-containing protein n=1 Tax=Limnohabitans sp. DM1 TaxID=1597955 RepID=UPI000AE85CEC|nr:DUF2235 domain-containing protein [Limnohabitans sp. DM1]
MTAQSPNPFPTEGQRKLSAQELYERMQAHACLTTAPSAKPSCEGQVFVGLFFDGTGNNMDIDYFGGDGSSTEGQGRTALPPERRKHTNVVKLYQAFPRKPERGYLRIYLPGVGTPFPEVGDTNTSLKKSWLPNLGSAVAEMGEHRILWALLQLLNAPHRYVRGVDNPLIPNEQAKTICDTLASSVNPTSAPQRRAALQHWQKKLVQALNANLPRITQINLSVFGFSRGAAEARAFVNWLLEACEYTNGSWRFAGMALNLQFLGLFDTVASVGLANLLDDGTFAGHQGWADNTLQVHPAVRQCVHMVAGHELRACFPLDSARVQGSYPANVKEVVYPGAHSDVGGGYAPGSLGVMLKPQDNMSILPGRDMYEAARNAGVPLPVFASLKEQNPDLFLSLTPSDSLTQLYNAYLREAAVAPGPVEDMLRQHMSLYHSFRFKWHARFESVPTLRQANEQHARFLRSTQKDFIDCLHALGGGDANAQGASRLLPPPLVSSSQFLAQPRTLTAAPASPASILPRISDRQKNPWTNPHFDPAAAATLYRQLAAKTGYRLSARESKWCDVAERIRPQALTDNMERLFAYHLHDSLAGFIDMGVDEFRSFGGNQLGLSKFRTVFKGND